MTHLGDITKIDWFHVPPVDVVTGGSPCQDLSVAGKRAGLAGERSGLYMEQIRCVKELRQADEQRGRTGFAIRPRYMVWENVPGAFSSNGGKDFAAVLEEAVKVVCPESPPVPVPEGGWPTSGCLTDGVAGRWSIAWRVHDAQFWGVAQRRRRISVVCDFGGLSAPEILFERKGLSGDFEPGGTPGKEAAGGAGNGVEGASGCMTGWDCQSKRIFSPDGICATLNSGDREGGNITPSVFCAGFSYGQSAKASSVGYQEERSPTLRSGEGGNQKPCVYDARGNGDGKTVCTLTGDHQNRVTDYKALCVGNGQLNQISMAEQVNTLNTMHDQQAVMIMPFDTTQITSPENGCHPHYGDPCHPLAAQAHVPSIVAAVDCRVNSVVRRLTPLECERLQGYPDGWTDIGEWVDSKGKRHKDADSPRYKALGNSIALPFWFWLLRRISAQYIGPATLGSLFDGIGGFPLCWERCNGKGTALWASEIEEFPMAVTRRHFGEDEWHDIEILEKWAQEEEGL